MNVIYLNKKKQKHNIYISILFYLSLDYSHLLHRSIVLVALDQSDAFHRLHARVDAAENRVLSVQPLRWRQCYEELRTVRIRSGIRHRQDPGAGVLQIGVEFIGKRCSVNGRSAAAGTGRVAALDHKVLDDTMEDRVVVVSTTDQFGEIATSVWGMLPVQLDGEFAHAGTTTK